MPRNNQNKRPRRRRKRRGRRKPKPKMSGVDRYARMLADPCNSVLVPGFFGTTEGYLATVRSSFTNNSEGSSGYCLWSPATHDNGVIHVNEVTFNLWGFSTNDSAVPPINTPTDPFGFGDPFDVPLVVHTAGGIPDPASQFIGSAGHTAQDARLISACMRATYTGRMDRNSGQIIYVDNLPISALIDSTDDNQDSVPLSVDDLFRLNGGPMRLSTDTLEIAYRTSENCDIFRDTTDSCVGWFGAQNAEVKETAEQMQAPVFGFAWRGLELEPGQGAAISFDLTKNIEWRPRAQLGLKLPKPKVVSSTSHVRRVKQALDNADPNWSKRLISGAESVAGSIAKAAFTGFLGPEMTRAVGLLL